MGKRVSALRPPLNRGRGHARPRSGAACYPWQPSTRVHHYHRLHGPPLPPSPWPQARPPPRPRSGAACYPWQPSTRVHDRRRALELLAASPDGCAILLAHGFSKDMSRLSDEWSDDDFDVLADGVVVGRIMKAIAHRRGRRGCGRWPAHEDHTPTHGYAATREAEPLRHDAPGAARCAQPRPLPCRTHGGAGRCALRSD